MFNLWKSQERIGQSFGLEQKPQSVDGMFKIALRRGFGFFLEKKEIIMNLLRVEIGGEFTEVKRESGDVSGIIGKGTLTSSEHRDRPFKAVKEISEAGNLALSAMGVLILS